MKAEPRALAALRDILFPELLFGATRPKLADNLIGGSTP